MQAAMLQRGVTDPTRSYISNVKDFTLPGLLSEAMKLLEARFINLDADKADTLTFAELSHELSLVGFKDQDKLEALFRKVDTDKSGTLDFSEFLSLLYLWHNVENGDYSAFFRHPTNAKLVADAFAMMEAQMTKYDADRSRRLSAAELEAFFSEQWPAATYRQYGIFEEILPYFVKGGKDLAFPGFMLLLYTVACKVPNSTLVGKYAPRIAAPENNRPGKGSDFWMELAEAFVVLETDFRRFDRDGSGLITFAEITAGMPPTRPGYDRLQIVSKLEHAFQHVDFDGSQTLDFHEFMYLGFNMTRNGSYLDLVQDSADCRKVKGMFIHLHAFYNKYDQDRNKRLTYDELEILCQEKFLTIPPELPGLFDMVKYQSSATEGRPAVDMVRFMKLLYMLICPDGTYHPRRYDPTRQAVAARSAASVDSVSQPTAAAIAHPPRIRSVVPSHFAKGKLLGQGGQGMVYAGTYDGLRCAGKFLLGEINAEVVRAARAEVDFFQKLDHPNCHYLLGAKTTTEGGGMLFLTEICANGSLFDFYATKRRTFTPPTAMRLALECAQGLQEIHAMGYMHRDVKSLNVFLTEGMVAQIADFGMCTDETSSCEVGGTPQWMAPEVIRNLFNQRTTYGKSVDVYSYGILLWELMHCRVPYADTGLNQMAIAQAVMKQNIRPKMGQTCPPVVRDLITACWNVQPAARPSFLHLIRTLPIHVDEITRGKVLPLC